MKTTLINKVLPLVVVAFIGLFFAISCEKEKNSSEPIIIDYFNNSNSLLYKEVDTLFLRACRTDTNIAWQPWTWTQDSLYVILVDEKSFSIIDSNSIYRFVFDIVRSVACEPQQWLFLFYTNRKIYPNQIDTVVINGHYQWQ